VSLINLIDFKSLGDDRGQLFSLEGNKNIPFDIKRIYYMYGMQSDVPRGFHAHKELQQVAVCIKGSCKLQMDDGRIKEEIVIGKANTGLVIDKLIWHEMHDFSDDCILMVIASDHYDENDYIRNYKQFMKFIEKLND
jgi:dTDP-4-dehydrorhamnose 3,5-epimerase-like enzyme